jgi:hypothetical protein
MGAVSVVATVPDAPAESVPTLILAAFDVAASDTSEIVTATDLAVALPSLATVSWTGVVAPAFTVAFPSLSALGTMSALSVGAGAGVGA